MELSLSIFNSSCSSKERLWDVNDDDRVVVAADDDDDDAVEWRRMCLFRFDGSLNGRKQTRHCNGL